MPKDYTVSAYYIGNKSTDSGKLGAAAMAVDVTGVYGSELTLRYRAFLDAGLEVDIANIKSHK